MWFIRMELNVMYLKSLNFLNGIYSLSVSLVVCIVWVLQVSLINFMNL